MDVKVVIARMTLICPILNFYKCYYQSRFKAYSNQKSNPNNPDLTLTLYSCFYLQTQLRVFLGIDSSFSLQSHFLD